MKYRDLIQFEPVEGVIKLRQADDREKAEKFVSTYVISDRMADVMLHRFLPALDLNNVGDGGGIFVVGNYGTGKSHLMSVVSAVAEYDDLSEKLTHPAVIEGFGPIVGKFKVIRQEFGSTKMPLRDVVVHYLERGLADMGVDFTFPDMDEAPNAKDSLVEMMYAFGQQYPDYGLLVVIDELLDYLRARKEKELIRDLGFLREIGEICEQTRLRFIAGLQESLFDSPRFQFAADSIRRVKDRFNQVRIVRQDVAHVVSRRLLAKTQAQRARIREHLEKFTPLYDSMAENLDAFVELFPVHPAYLEMFEQVIVIEKRQVLKALSQEMRNRLDDDVPDNAPGVLSFDSYWGLIKADASYRSVPEIREVLEKYRVLEDRVENALAMPDYKPAAQRILNALALHRLSVGELRAPIGLTARELRDRLCLSIPTPEPDAPFLLISVEAVLAEISKTVSGQFISKNPDNGQFFLDLDKDIDFDALIEQKADTLDDDDLDRYYFDMLARAMELTDIVHVPGFNIWQREMPWTGQGITRLGYIFLGAPNERSTAQPPRDFYLHFLALHSSNGKSEASQPDEIYFNLANRDTHFDDALRLYAGAREMSLISSGDYRRQYGSKAEKLVRTMIQWLRENFVRAFEIRYRDEPLSPAKIMSRYRVSVHDLSLRDQVYRLAGACLNEYWAKEYPRFPRFETISFTMETLTQGANASLQAIAGSAPTRPAQSILTALKVARMDGRKLVYTLEQSPYAQHILKELHARPTGKVLNRGTLLEGRVESEIEREFGLELPLLAVLLLALARQGEITINVLGRRFDSDDLDEAARLGVDELLKFTSISRPKSLPEQALRAIFAGFGIPEGYVADSSKHNLAVEQLQAATLKELDETTRASERLREGLQYWAEPILASDEQKNWRKDLNAYRDFLDSLQHLNTPGRLRNLSYDVGQVRQHLQVHQLLADLRTINETLQVLGTHLDYVYQAYAALPAGHVWRTEADELQAEHLKLLRNPERRAAASTRSRLNGGLANLKTTYATAYLKLHNRARLNTSQDTRKKRLTRDPRWGQLQALSSLPLLPELELQKLEAELGDLESCPGVGLSDLKTRTTCSCGFVLQRTDKPKPPASETLEKLTAEFDTLYERWVTTVQENLKQASQQKNIKMIAEKPQTDIQDFIRTGKLPEKISYVFTEGLQDALQGLEKVIFDGADLLLALTRPGMPCTPEEFHTRFARFVDQHIQDKDPAKTRTQIDW